MITYKKLTYGYGVYLEGARVGMIKQKTSGFWRYVPKAGIKYAGHSFSRLGECMRYLEAQNAQ